MAKHYVYVFIKELTGPLNIGFSKDIIASIAFEGRLPVIKEPSRLIYLEIADNLESANERFEHIYRLNRQQKFELIQNQNPDLITIQPGVNMVI